MSADTASAAAGSVGFDMTDTVVLVTGAAGGVGGALVEAFVARGASVVATDIDVSRLPASVVHRPGAGSVTTIAADLSDPQACRDLIAHAVVQFGRLDALVNNAALLRMAPLASFSIDAFDEMVAVNLRAPFVLTQAAFEWMSEHGGGRIVNIASVGARDGGGSLDVAAYTTVKSGLLGMTKAFAKFGAPMGILVNTVLPGGIATPMIAAAAGDADRRRPDVPIGRLADPAEIARLVCWLCSPENTYCAGASIDINGGRYLS
jgi:NAD(P)-dependent dehydrogenase (short-subunit alcohol dehydrogenase family)